MRPPEPTFTYFIKRVIKAPDSITDRASGLVSKRRDTAMRERFFSFKQNIRKNSQKNMSVRVKYHSAYFFFHKFLCQNSSFFIIEENRIFLRYEINRFFTINSLLFVPICPK